MKKLLLPLFFIFACGGTDELYKAENPKINLPTTNEIYDKPVFTTDDNTNIKQIIKIDKNEFKHNWVQTEIMPEAVWAYVGQRNWQMWIGNCAETEVRIQICTKQLTSQTILISPNGEMRPINASSIEPVIQGKGAIVELDEAVVEGGINCSNSRFENVIMDVYECKIAE